MHGEGATLAPGVGATECGELRLTERQLMKPGTGFSYRRPTRSCRTYARLAGQPLLPGSIPSTVKRCRKLAVSA
jgi:hypothetical protein